MPWYDRWLIPLVIWVGVLEEGADVRWPAWLYRLDDSRDAWRGEDKQVHVLGIALAAVLYGPWVALIVGVVVEVIQALLWMSLTPTKRMLIEDGKLAWPWMHDRASLKDLVADVAGIALAAVLLRIG